MPTAYEPVLAAAIAWVAENDPDAELHLYGSVATGQAVIGRSDVDLISIGVPGDAARAACLDLSARFDGLCRSVDVGAAQPDHYRGESNLAYGNRVFLRHYCVPLTTADLASTAEAYPADARAARGFNGDIGEHAGHWRAAAGEADPAGLARRVGRKSLLAVAGLVSVHDKMWTTDREFAARRWAELRPEWADALDDLLAWGESVASPEPSALREALSPTGVVAAVETAFADQIGLWSPSPLTEIDPTSADHAQIRP